MSRDGRYEPGRGMSRDAGGMSWDAGGMSGTRAVCPGRGMSEDRV